MIRTHAPILSYQSLSEEYFVWLKGGWYFSFYGASRVMQLMFSSLLPLPIYSMLHHSISLQLVVRSGWDIAIPLYVSINVTKRCSWIPGYLEWICPFTSLCQYKAVSLDGFLEVELLDLCEQLLLRLFTWSSNCFVQIVASQQHRAYHTVIGPFV